MALYEDYSRAIMLLIAGLILAAWIQINYSFETGAIYITMMLISIFIYLIADKLGIIKGVGGPILTLFGIDKNPVVDSIIGVIGGFLFICAMESTSLTMGLPPPMYPLTSFAEQISIVSDLIVRSVLAPIGEEMFFCGIFLWFTRKNVKYFTPAVIIVSLAFAAFHYTRYGADIPAAYVGAFLFRFIMCYLVYYTNSILPAVIVHAMVNTQLYIKAEELLVVGV